MGYPKEIAKALVFVSVLDNGKLSITAALPPEMTEDGKKWEQFYRAHLPLDTPKEALLQTVACAGQLALAAVQAVELEDVPVVEFCELEGCVGVPNEAHGAGRWCYRHRGHARKTTK